MNKKNLIIVSLVIAGLGLFVLGASRGKITSPAKIGIVSVREVFDKCTMKTEAEKSLSDEGDKRFAELKRLEESIESGKVTLNKFKEGSQDYLDTLKELMVKQSQLEAQKEFYQQELGLKEMRNKEDIYRKILEITEKVAKEKDLDIILNRDDNYLSQPESASNPPAQNPTELILTTKTHKLLYFNKDLDITEDVIREMNNAKKK
ncbi:MAG: OmpH family outer membrane protein [Phycisphaerae bacterium]|nr:OmpH family outer membrane protein [Phycisphaerae bacterium]